MKVNQALWDKVKGTIDSRTEKEKKITEITIKSRKKEKSEKREKKQINLSQYDRQ